MPCRHLDVFTHLACIQGPTLFPVIFKIEHPISGAQSGLCLHRAPHGCFFPRSQVSQVTIAENVLPETNVPAARFIFWARVLNTALYQKRNQLVGKVPPFSSLSCYSQMYLAKCWSLKWEATSSQLVQQAQGVSCWGSPACYAASSWAAGRRN